MLLTLQSKKLQSLRKLSNALCALIFMLLSACGTSDATLRNQGHTESYLQGFHDGRHSGMQEEGNNYEHYIRDESRFNSDQQYSAGWLAGESEGKRLQDQATAAGNAAAGAYGAAAVNREVQNQNDPERAAEEVLKHTDTTSLKNLEK